ncbi:MAG: hypothetical protein I8H75_05115 [Myxococcaceae bacterium]|nr:hypothetical protein [Myxococcaceae bacterium]
MELLEKTLKNPKIAFTLADAATASGLSMHETERSLYRLIGEYRGELIPTEKGELLFRFPTGFSKPWLIEENWGRTLKVFKRWFMGVAKAIVRAWIAIVMVAYVAIFAALLMALSLAHRSGRENNRSSSFASPFLFDLLFRLILDALYWTWHPFRSYRSRYPISKKPFYERVNGFFFGVEEQAEDPLEKKRLILREIRERQGRIGLLDVLRVTGMTRREADPFIAKLLVEFNGDIHVSEHGGITYSFSELRRTAQSPMNQAKSYPWLARKRLLPLTGNSSGENALIASLNGFNFLISTVALSEGWTFAKLGMIFQGMHPSLVPQNLGVPILLGWIPFGFSLVLFALPVIRFLNRPREQARIDRDNGRRGLLWTVIHRITPKGIPEATLVNAWQQAAGSIPSEAMLLREVVELGGELQVEEATGFSYYHFPELELEQRAVEAERVKASKAEAEAGKEVPL